MKPLINSPLTYALALVTLSFGAAIAETADQTRADVQATLGGVPSFVSAIADPALPGIWAEQKSLILSQDTALDSKTKALIGLAVAAQIPCDYCIYAGNLDAIHAGATQQEIAEAVAVAGFTRNMSTIFNGMQVDFNQFKSEMGGN
jgi:AhpD family alkylhydroperoxidase